MIIVRLLSPEPAGCLAPPTLLGSRSRHCHGINSASNPVNAQLGPEAGCLEFEPPFKKPQPRTPTSHIQNRELLNRRKPGKKYQVFARCLGVALGTSRAYKTLHTCRRAVQELRG